jgi:hypothetical protein
LQEPVHVRSLISLLVVLALASPALADPPAKKPLYPPPEQSKSVGTLGGPRPDAAPAKKLSSEPPPPVAAPEVFKVEAEQPTALSAAPREVVQSDQPAGTGGSALMTMPQTPPTGFLPDHPVISGLVAGLIGSDLGSKLYGGAMTGDRTAAGIGFAVRIALVLTLALLLFRFIGRRASAGDDRLVMPKTRRDPSFGRGEPMADGRREPHFGRNR